MTLKRGKANKQQIKVAPPKNRAAINDAATEQTTTKTQITQHKYTIAASGNPGRGTLARIHSSRFPNLFSTIYRQKLFAWKS